MLKQNLMLNATAFILSTAFSLFFNFISTQAFTQWYFLGPCFFVLFFVSGMISAHRSKLDDFTAYLLLNLSLKLLAAFIFIALSAFFYSVDFLSISIQFIFHFLTFTLFEIRYVYLLVKIKSGKNQTNTLTSQ